MANLLWQAVAVAFVGKLSGSRFQIYILLVKTMLWVKNLSFFIYSILSYSLSHITKNFFTFSFIYIYHSIVFLLQVKKTLFFMFFAFLVSEILLFQTYFSPKISVFHLSYRWIALEKYISNRYTFMGQNLFIPFIYCLIIFPFFSDCSQHSL